MGGPEAPPAAKSGKSGEDVAGGQADHRLPGTFQAFGQPGVGVEDAAVRRQQGDLVVHAVEHRGQKPSGPGQIRLAGIAAGRPGQQGKKAPGGRDRQGQAAFGQTVRHSRFRAQGKQQTVRDLGQQRFQGFVPVDAELGRFQSGRGMRAYGGRRQAQAGEDLHAGLPGQLKAVQQFRSRSVEAQASGNVAVRMRHALLPGRPSRRF